MEFLAQAPGQHQICYVECPKLENENLITNTIAYYLNRSKNSPNVSLWFLSCSLRTVLFAVHREKKKTSSCSPETVFEELLKCCPFSSNLLVVRQNLLLLSFTVDSTKIC